MWKIGIVGAALVGPALAQVTQRVNLSSRGAEAGESQYHLSFTTLAVTHGGRFVVFFSDASNLVPGDTNGKRDIFLRDRRTGTTERVSVDSNGAQGNAGSNYAWCSEDCRYVSFSSDASNLVPGDTNGVTDAFVRDRVVGTTERVNVASDGTQANGSSYWCPITPDGRYVVFQSSASNLVPGDTNSEDDVFVRDRQTGRTELVSVSSNGTHGNFASSGPFISDDGRFVSFRSEAWNLVAGDTNGAWDAFVHDRQTGATERVNVSSGGAQSNPSSDDYGVTCMISADGRFALFRTNAGNLVPGDTNHREDLFVRDRVSHTTERVSLGSNMEQGNDECYGGSISADGRYVAFSSAATNLVPGATMYGLAYVRDRVAGTTELASVDSHGVPANGSCLVVQASISADGRFVTFDSWATNLVPGDGNNASDVFIRDRWGGTSFTSSCDPGVGGVMACPCANPPSGPGRGCENSSRTGGAVLAASGGAFLSSESLVFESSGETPNALSVLVQGNAVIPGGVLCGQGVHCLGGAILRRLFTKTALHGGIAAPDFGDGDPSISVRAAEQGDMILPGESRSYFVCYRDPFVPGGCPASSTFNATQTGQVTWSP
jgi:archaellum component FlaF (FlaF/FlaG flagellin family)